MALLEEILQAEHRIRPYIHETPLDPSRALGREAGCEAFVKLENLQFTGSFKVRGALNKLLSLTPAQRARGCVAASTGNHGAAVAFGVHTLGMEGTIYVPEDASPAKLDAIRQWGADVVPYGAEPLQSELQARRVAEAEGRVYISPYNDVQVVAGQGTVGVELMRQLERIDTLYVSLGGGGLVSGIGCYLKAVSEKVHIVACSPAHSAIMDASVKAGRILDLASRPTLSDGTAGGIEPGAVTFDYCRAYVDDYVRVSEEEIAAAMRFFMKTHHQLIEGAAGVALAAFLKTKQHLAGKRVAVVICGANISLATLKSIL